MPTFTNETANHTGASNYTIQLSKEIQAVLRCHGRQVPHFFLTVSYPVTGLYTKHEKRSCATEKPANRWSETQVSKVLGSRTGNQETVKESRQEQSPPLTSGHGQHPEREVTEKDRSVHRNR